MKKLPDEITLCDLEVIVMPNGEVICLGKIVGCFEELSKCLTKITKEEV